MGGFTSACRRFMPTLSIPIAVGLGVALGLVLRTYALMTDLDKEFINFPGEMFMRMMQLITIPLIVSNLVTEICCPSVDISRRITMRSTVYIALTNSLAVAIGLIAVLLIQPGFSHNAGKTDDDPNEIFSTLHAFVDLLWNMLPQDVIQTTCQKFKTTVVKVENRELDENDLETITTEESWGTEYIYQLNALGLIVWTPIYEVTFRSMGKEGELLLDILRSTNKAIKLVIKAIVGLLPIAVLFMTISYVVEVEYDLEAFIQIGKFVGVIVAGLAIHGAVVLPLLYLLCVRRNPFCVIRRGFPAMMRAVLMSHSSAATMTETVNVVDRRITRFMLPIGNKVNMNGTALYEVVAVVFIAQVNHIELNWSQLFMVCVMVAVANVGDDGIPTTGTATTLFILTVTQIPARGVCLLFAVEWLLDRCNAAVNVLGDCIGVSIVHHLSEKELEEINGE